MRHQRENFKLKICKNVYKTNEKQMKRCQKRKTAKIRRQQKQKAA